MSCKHPWAITKDGEMICINCRENILDLLAAANTRVAEVEAELALSEQSYENLYESMIVANEKRKAEREQAEAQNKRMRESISRYAMGNIELLDALKAALEEKP